MQLSIPVVNTSNSTKSSIEVQDKIFGQPFNESLVHQVVTAYMANGRQGTHAQKNRAAVSGGGKKPWKQKGTGQARAGTTRSPIWRKGGVTFAAKTQDYSQKINKKMYKAAMRSILSELHRQDRLIIVDELTISAPKTKEFLTKLKPFNLKESLIVLDSIDNNLYLAVRNLINFDVRDVAGTDPVSLIGFKKVIMTSAAVKQFEDRLS